MRPDTEITQTGRPTDYSLELAEQICLVLSSSSITISRLAGLEGMPAKATIFRWLAKQSEFRDLYARARGFQSELGYDDMEDIVNAPLTHNGKPAPESDEEYDPTKHGRPLDAGLAMAEIQRRKLQVDIMKFRLTKLQAKRFGDNRNVDLNVNVKHNVSAEQYNRLLTEAAAAPKAIAQEYDEAEVITEALERDTVADDFAELVDDDDDLG